MSNKDIISSEAKTIDPVNKDFATRILEGLSNTPISSFSPLEDRLIKIMSELVPRFITYVWMEGADTTQGPLTRLPELTEKVVTKTIRLSLIGAIEADEQLRQLRK